MRLKKIFAVLMICIFSAAVLTGCGEEKKVEAPATSEFKIGMIRHMNSSEKDFNNFMKKVAETFALKMSSYDPIFFDNLNSMQAALESKQINAFAVHKCVGEYLTAKNPKLEIADNDALEFIDSFCFAFRENDRELLDITNKAVKEMREDGTIDRLISKYITDIKADEEIPAVEIPTISGANTIKVAVTGDLPPIDFINNEGQAAGFNTALLAEISRRIGKNIELVQIDSGSREVALTSGRVDIIFWAVVPVSGVIPADSDKPAKIGLTAPYYKGKIVHVKLKE